MVASMSSLAHRQAISRFFSGHPLISHKAMEGFVSHAAQGRVVFQDDMRPTMFNPHIVGSVSGLSSDGGPAAVPRSVRAIYVNPVKRKPARFLTHVGKEILKPGKPSLAHHDPATAVIGKFGIARICAAALGVSIGPIGRRRFSTDRMTVRSRAGCRFFFADASAAFGDAAPNVFEPNFLHSPAITSKRPNRPATGSGNPVDGHKSSEPLPGDVERNDHLTKYPDWS